MVRVDGKGHDRSSANLITLFHVVLPSWLHGGGEDDGERERGRGRIRVKGYRDVCGMSGFFCRFGRVCPVRAPMVV